MAEPKTVLASDDAVEAAVGEAIAECGGDMRAAIRALIVAMAHLDLARDRAIDLVSAGYARGRHKQSRDGAS